MAESLEFEGRYTRGIGCFSKCIQMPGQCEVTKTIDGWPANVHPGTMNVKIDPAGFPHALTSRFNTKSIGHLDSRLFKSITEIPARDIGGNTLSPTITCPDKGNGQVWRARITKLMSWDSRDCWLFRRIGSGYTDILEFVAGESLSTALELSHGDSVRAVIYGAWANS